MTKHYKYSKGLRWATFCCFLFLFIFTNCGPKGHGKASKEKAKEDSIAQYDTTIQVSKDYIFVDTLGKTYFIFEKNSGPPNVSDAEITEYLIFEIDAKQNSFYSKDKGLRNINCMSYSTQFWNSPALDTSYMYVRNGKLFGRKINNDTWEIYADLNDPYTKVSFKELFIRSKRHLNKMEDGIRYYFD